MKTWIGSCRSRCSIGIGPLEIKVSFERFLKVILQEFRNNREYDRTRTIPLTLHNLRPQRTSHLCLHAMTPH